MIESYHFVKKLQFEGKKWGIDAIQNEFERLFLFRNREIGKNIRRVKYRRSENKIVPELERERERGGVGLINASGMMLSS